MQTRISYNTALIKKYDLFQVCFIKLIKQKKMNTDLFKLLNKVTNCIINSTRMKFISILKEENKNSWKHLVSDLIFPKTKFFFKKNMKSQL